MPDIYDLIDAELKRLKEYRSCEELRDHDDAAGV